MSGCSVLLMNGPPPGDGPLPEGTCSTSVVAPALDAAWSALWVFGLVATTSDDNQNDYVDEVYAVAFGLPAAGWGYSAYKGFTWTSECRRRQALSEEAIADHLRALAGNARGVPRKESR